MCSTPWTRELWRAVSQEGDKRASSSASHARGACMKAQKQLQTAHLTSPARDDVKVEKSHRLTNEQEQALVERARTGDDQARETIILSLQSWLEHVAAKCSHTYNWKSV